MLSKYFFVTGELSNHCLVDILKFSKYNTLQYIHENAQFLKLLCIICAQHSWNKKNLHFKRAMFR